MKSMGLEEPLQQQIEDSDRGVEGAKEEVHKELVIRGRSGNRYVVATIDRHLPWCGSTASTEDCPWVGGSN